MQVDDQPEIDLAQQIAYAISHDLRAPARHIQAFVDILVKHVDDQLDGTAMGYLTRLTEAAEVLDEKLDALTRYSRVSTQGIEPVRCSAAEAVSQALALLEAEIAESGAEITIDDLPEVVADPQQLVTVFSELIDNALKFSPDGVSIRIASDPSVHEAVITVEDSGPGIASANADSVFELYRRFHPSSIPGTGAGLAIVERIVKRHGGWIAIEDGDSCGARIQLSLPTAHHDGQSNEVSGG